MSFPNRAVRRNLLRLLSIAFLAACFCSLARAQATATASVSGVSLSVGGGYSYYHADYGHRMLGGYSIFADYDRTPRWGLEFEVRALRFNQEFNTHQTTLLIGPRYAYRRNRFSAYAKLLLGDGRFHFPYNYADGSYFVLAPGGGIDVPLGDSRFTIRAVDLEYQSWPNFSFGGLHPYGYSGGISFRVLN
jgi:Outer membrane protein beta-barrel domain